MISLFTTVLLVQLLIYTINAVGAQSINELLWQLRARIPLSSSKDVKEQLRLRKEVVRLKREMAAISAQDNFAAWAKLRREHDKSLAAHDKKAAEVAASKASFDTRANILRWTMTSGLQMFLQFWHSKNPVFTYPQGWLPWPVEFLLAFPRCPYGAVSINIWSMACGTVIALCGNAVMEAMSLQNQPESQKKGVKMESGKMK